MGLAESGPRAKLYGAAESMSPALLQQQGFFRLSDTYCCLSPPLYNTDT